MGMTFCENILNTNTRERWVTRGETLREDFHKILGYDLMSYVDNNSMKQGIDKGSKKHSEKLKIILIKILRLF